MPDKAITPFEITVIGEAIARIIHERSPHWIKEAAITDVLELRFPEYGRIKPGVFYAALDEARNSYPLIAGNNGHKWASTQEEYNDYLNGIDKSAINTHIKIKKRRRISVEKPPLQRSLF